MKKNMLKKFSILMVALLMSIGLAACGGADMSDSPYLGTWSASTAEYSGIEMAVDSIIGGEFTVTLEKVGGCTVSISGEEDSGKWTETENGFNVEDEFDFTVDGDTAVLDYEGITLYFQR